jgi:hypothetical protein
MDVCQFMQANLCELPDVPDLRFGRSTEHGRCIAAT